MSSPKSSDPDRASKIGCGIGAIILGILGAVLGAVVVVVLICVVMFRSFLADEGFVATPDRSIQENIQVLKTSPSASERGQAIDQIAKGGAEAQEAVPALLKALRDDSKYVYRIMRQIAVHEKAANALVKIGGPKVVEGLAKLLADEDDKMVLRSARVLHRLGPAGEDAVPQLLAAWKKATKKQNAKDGRQLHRQISATLTRIGGPKVVDAFSKLLSEEDETIVMAAAATLAKLGPAAKEAVPALLAILKKTKDQNVRGNITSALARIGSREAEEGLAKLAKKQVKVLDPYKALREALSHTDATVRANAAGRLGAIGPKADSTVPHLTKLLKDSDSEVRMATAWALWAVAHEAKDTFPILVASLKDSRDDVRQAAQQKLNRIGPKDVWALDALVKNLEAEDKHLRLETVKAIGRMGPGASKAKGYRLLVNALLDSDDEIRKAVALAIKNTTEPTQKAK